MDAAYAALEYLCLNGGLMKKVKEKNKIKAFQNIRVLFSVVFNTSCDKNVSKNNILVKSKLEKIR